MAKKILITGANYNNKGAQSMLFITIDELKKRIPDCDIYFGCGLMDPKVEHGAFKQICYSREGRYIAVGGRKAVFNYGVAVAKALIAICKGKKAPYLFRFMDVRKYTPQMDLIIDVSGFTLGDKWSRRTNENFLNVIRLAKRYDIPMFVMPQSFGPFAFPDKLKDLKKEIAKLLAYPKVVFAREKEGYDFLTKDFGLTNVELSSDLVLQNTGVDLNNIFTVIPKLHVPQITTSGNVAVIPNSQCFRHGEEERILEIYRQLLDVLLKAGRNVYVFQHSGEDFPYCKKIVEQYGEHERLHLLQQNLSCLEYDVFVRQFDCIICSRFHGIVHAYRNHVPVLALGWAVKYRELTALVGQSRYIYDITAPDCDVQGMKAALSHMLEHIEEEQQTIEECVQKIQADNCFSCISEWVKEENE